MLLELAPASFGQRDAVLFERTRECRRRGKEALFEKHHHKASSERGFVLVNRREARVHEFLEQRMDATFFGRVVDFQRQKFALGEYRVAVLVGDVAFEAAHHDLLKLRFARFDRAGEALVVKKFEKRCK